MLETIVNTSWIDWMIAFFGSFVVLGIIVNEFLP